MGRAIKPDALIIAVERRILRVRGQYIMVDYDLAELYGVETGALNRAVKRNPDRFPSDFMFQLSGERDARLEMPDWHFKSVGWASSQSVVRL